MTSIYNKNKSTISIFTGVTVLGLGIYSNSLCGVLGVVPIITVFIKNYSMSPFLGFEKI